MKNYKICVHIPFYVDSNFKKKNILLNKVCKSYLKLSTKLKIFVHTNKITKKNSKRINFILHNFKNDHPYKLTWKCRKLMFSQRNEYEIFIFGEDDIVFSRNNFKYWLKYKDKSIKNNFNLGFLRVEINKKNNLLYSTDQISKIKYYVNVDKKKFVKLENSNCSFWIYDKNEFKKFIMTKYWKFYWKWITISGILLIREMAAVGWHGEDMNGQFMNKYQATIIPLIHNKLDKNSYIKHISNKYANDPAGLFGTIKINNIMNENLKKLKIRNVTNQVILRLKFLIYRALRFNFKNLIKSF
jgi:hypothetical protein